MNSEERTLAPERAVGGDKRVHFPGLDGLRGFALLLVLFVHQGYGWAKGGLIGLPIFFSLSGFLITTLLISEYDRTGRIRIGSFLARRARRLAPSALIAAIAIVVVWLIIEGNTPSPSVGPDLIASVFNVANWWFIIDNQSYGDLFATASPLRHYWSLAVEEQLYVLWPFMLVAILRLRTKRSRVAVATLIVLISASFTFMTDSFDLLYYGTHVRAAELLSGAVLALAVAGQTAMWAERRDRTAKMLIVVSWVLVGLLLVGVATLGQDSWVWRNGGLALVGAVSAVIVLGAVVPGSLRTALSQSVLRWIGRWCYVIYLVHWPVFILLTADRTGLPGWSIFPARMLVTLIPALALGLLVEQPIRSRRVLRRTGAAASVYAITTFSGVVIATVLMNGVREPSDGIVTTGPQVFVNTEVPSSEVRALPPLRVLVVGSTSSSTPLADHRDLGLVFIDERRPGCPFIDAVEVAGIDAVGVDVAADLSACPRQSSWAGTLALAEADAVLVTIGAPDSGRVRVEPGDQMLSRIATRARMLDTLRNAIRDFRRTDVPILLAAESDVRPIRRDQAEAILDVVALTDPGVRVVAAPTTPDDLVAVRTTLDELLGTDPEANRLLILGDSTGASLSRIIFEETSGEQETVGLAQEGCPLVPVDGIRWWDGVTFELTTCPTLDDIRSYVEILQPRAVLISASLMEQAEFRVGDGEWIDPTMDAYRLLHDLYMEELQAALATVGTTPVIWVLDSPSIPTGAFSTSPMAQPDRIAAWNAQIDRWTEQWVNVRRLPWASALALLEDAEGSVREDGVHIDEPSLRRMVADLLIPSLADDAAVRREMRQTGCGRPGAGVDACRRVQP